MLISLHVKNLALIQETEVNFKEGLNILSGETGAGKSIIIGSINLALGARADKDMIRNGAEYALIELVFQVTDETLLEAIHALEIPVEEDGVIIIQRRIQPTRSICKIGGETATTRQLKELSELLIDIHGQHEHQSLLYKKNHMAILDAFASEELSELKAQLKKVYHEYNRLQQELDETGMDEGVRAKELSLAEFEYNEITEAHLVVGEDDELEASYRRMSNSRQIVEAASHAYQMTGDGDESSAADAIGRAVRELRSIESYDEGARNLAQELTHIDDLLGDFNRGIAQYLSDMEFDGQVFADTEERLNVLNHLKLKYGGTIEAVLSYAEQQAERIEQLQNMDAYREQLRTRLSQTQDELTSLCEKVSAIRRQEASSLSKDMIAALTDLHFLEVNFEIQVRRKEYTSEGYDDVEFMISTNPGEPLKSLGSVASGGELSRIMLAIKTVLAARDRIPTMIFDEIDTGISGKTAWKVSEKLGMLSTSHQIICITHLPQIAAMGDAHYRIAKHAEHNTTVTTITELTPDDTVEELARLLGGEEITDTVRENARELLHTAATKKHR